ncbi:uncharacterized protein NEMAJ01_1660 [Nematocida major]|uniref:uncharacterized protein n=1 Tax=Nematocida major TaxID=1912982 RepID=UPI0020086EF2|nr:uncharacterized protein NEMAJ01_1660 [Nematocida major]KAH9386764.1 hypothetical protein NEMAJ01_1660 [Nematocida major]
MKMKKLLLSLAVAKLSLAIHEEAIAEEAQASVQVHIESAPWGGTNSLYSTPDTPRREQCFAEHRIARSLENSRYLSRLCIFLERKAQNLQAARSKKDRKERSCSREEVARIAVAYPVLRGIGDEFARCYIDMLTKRSAEILRVKMQCFLCALKRVYKYKDNGLLNAFIATDRYIMQAHPSIDIVRDQTRNQMQMLCEMFERDCLLLKRDLSLKACESMQQVYSLEEGLFAEEAEDVLDDADTGSEHMLFAKKMDCIFEKAKERRKSRLFRAFC